MTPPPDGNRAAVIAVTMGEPAGIGPEIALKAWQAGPPPDTHMVMVADAAHLRETAKALGLSIPIVEIENIAALTAGGVDGLPVLSVPLAGRVCAGQLSEDNAAAVTGAIELAVGYAMRDEIDAVVTNPINKLNLYNAGFAYPGHTEYLAALAGIAHEPIMMLACDQLRVVPVTRHLSLGDAVAALDQAIIVETVQTTVNCLQRDFGIPRPSIAVTGLNPHAGEGGSMGREELEIIQPAIAALKREGIAISGPYPADTLFHPAARQRYDVAVCMYHDQALIPIKTLDFEGAVNVTLGLPFIRTSPDHGTALDIAGKGVAHEASLAAAIEMAAAMAHHRRAA